MELVAFLFRQSRSVLVSAIVLGAISGTSSAGLLALINLALSGDSQWDKARFGWAFGGLCLFVTLATVLAHIAMVRLGQQAILDLRLRLSRQILATPLQHLEKLGPHRLLVALTDDITSLTTALTVVPAITINGGFVVGGLIYLGWLSPKLFLLLLALLGLGTASYYLPSRNGMAGFRVAREERDALYGHFRGITEGIKELKLHRRRRESLLGRLEATAESLRRHWVRAMTHFVVAARWGQLMIFGVIGLLILAPDAFQAGRETLTGYSLALLWLMTPLQVILSSVPDLGRAGVTIQKLEQLGFSLPRELDPETTAELTRQGQQSRSAKSLELREAVFAYRIEDEDREFVVGPIDLQLDAGELVFLIGGNGSGKTTLAKLLVGLYRPQAGEIRLDGQTVGEASTEAFRESWSTVFSDFFLFDGLLGLERPELDEQARQGLEKLRLSHKVEVTGGEFSTTALSQGQRKRLMLLTAWLEDRPFYLFDEWAADQDPEFKEIFYRQLLPQLRDNGKLVVVISHDDAYYEVADRIIKLDYGQVQYQDEKRNTDGIEPEISRLTP
ncbi:MAG: cyclic peptide export ABC transporter [Acidobacteriota bacterium]